MNAESRIVSHSALWTTMRHEAEELIEKEAILGSFLHATILNHDSLNAALSYHLANKLDSDVLPAMLLREVIDEAYADESELVSRAEVDITATQERDPACEKFSTPFLFFKGFHALQAHRVANWLWNADRIPLAMHLQSQVSSRMGVDIHPAATIGCGIMLDHATGIVIGETAVVEDDVSILHSVTLGGTGKESGDRHPKIRRGVLLAAGCKILGNIEIGEGAKVGAGSVVTSDVRPHVTVVGVPAREVGRPDCDAPALDMNQSIGDCS